MFARKSKRGIAISPSFLTWVDVVGTYSQPVLAASCLEMLPQGLVIPSFARENIADPAQIKKVLEKLIPAGKRSGDISLTIPDAVLKVSYLKFDELPRKREEIERLILWRLKKSIPLAPELAKVDYLVNHNADGSFDVVSAVASRNVIREYEDLVIDLGLKPKIVDASSMNLLNFFAEKLEGNFMFLAVNGSSISISIADGGKVKLFRHKELEINDDRIMKEVFATLTFFKNSFPDASVEGVYLFLQTDQLKSQLAEKLKASLEGHVSELDMESLLGQDGDPGLSGNLAPVIGGALRLK